MSVKRSVFSDTRRLLLRSVAQTSLFNHANMGTKNEDIVPAKTFINRNVRSLERFALAHKDNGWGRGRTEHELANMPERNFYHRICLERTAAHTHAFVEHYSGAEIISASTTEWGIRKHLYSSTDVTASSKIGLALAERCIRAGISCAVWVNCTDATSDANEAFCNAVTSTGFSLSEPDQLRFRHTKPHHRVLGPSPRPVE